MKVNYKIELYRKILKNCLLEMKRKDLADKINTLSDDDILEIFSQIYKVYCRNKLI